MKHVIYLIFLISIVQGAFAQHYFNEWVDYSKDYYKIKVAQDGLFKVNASDLVAKGYVPSAQSVVNLKVMHNGVEQPIYLNDVNNNGFFDGSDYFICMGERNTGVLDSTAYVTKSWQANKYYSLFTDSAAYFITEGSSPALRYSTYEGSNIVGASENYIFGEVLQLYTNTYYKGEPILNRAYRSDYKQAEGWFGAMWRKGSSNTINIALPQASTTLPTASLSLMMIGASNDIFTPNHHLRIGLGPNAGAITTIEDTIYVGYKSVEFNKSISSTLLIGGNPAFKFDIVNDLGVTLDDQALAYIKIKYARNLDAAMSNYLAFSVIGNVGNNRLTFTNFSASDPILYDISNGLRISGVSTLNGFDVMVPNGGRERNCILVDEAAVAIVSDIEKVRMRNLNPNSNNYEYIIVTSKSLLDSAIAYAAYRSDGSALGGGGYDTLLITIDEVYDQFYFGLYHPMAIKQFIKYLNAYQTVDPKFLLLLGKGYQTDLARKSEYVAKNLVPTYGVIGSDNMLTFGLNHGNYESSLPVGRIAARNPQDVGTFLTKVKQYEHKPQDCWMKKAYAVTGAFTTLETLRFTSYMDQFVADINDGSHGYDFIVYNRDISKAETSDPKTDIINAFNDGIGLYAYYGHGADLDLAVDIGFPDEYSNDCKYPFMFLSGCRVGDAFNNASLGEDFTLAERKGAIGWLAQSDLGFEGILVEIADLFYQNFASNMYGQPIGNIIHETLNQFQVTDDLSITHHQQTVYQGDPALVVYSAQQPDYQIGEVTFNQNASASIGNLQTCVEIKNCGKLSNQTINLRVQRDLPNNQQEVLIKQVSIDAFSTQFCFDFKTKDPSLAGNSTYTITIDANNQSQESNELNNQETVVYNLPLNKINLLYPRNYAIQTTPNLDLIAQDAFLKSNGVAYVLEIDTTSTFTSTWKQSFNKQSEYSLVKQNITVPFNNQVYYWRLRKSDETNWTTSSFTYIAGSNGGFNISDNAQLAEFTGRDIVFDATTQCFQFVRDQIKVSARANISLTGPAGSNFGIRTDETLVSGGNPCGRNVIVSIFDQTLLEPLTFSPFACTNGIVRGARAIDMTTTSGRAELANIINGLAQGQIFALISNRGGTGLPESQLLQQDGLPAVLATVGANIDMINALTANTSYCLVGRKGMAAGQAQQDTAIYSPGYDPRINVEYIGQGKWYKGSVTSKLIGPAKAWSSFNYELSSVSSADTYSFDLIGVASDSTETVLYAGVNTSNFNISAINALTYPWLRIRANFKDSLERTIPKLHRLQLLYTSVAEGTIYLDADYALTNDTVRQSQDFELHFKYLNLSNTISDTIFLHSKVVDANGNVDNATTTINPVSAFASQAVNIATTTQSTLGNAELLLLASPRLDFKDYFNLNNFICEPVFVKNFALDVDLIEFTATKAQNQEIVLSWSTVSEHKHSHFEIERLSNATVFENIGKVSAQGNTSVLQHYIFNDRLEPGFKGQVYYRLKMVDQDQSFKYSNIEKVLFGGEAGELFAYPNPAKDQVTIQNNTLNAISVTVFDLSGKVVTSNDFDQSMQIMDVSHLQNGCYYLQLISNETVVNSKLIIRK